MDYPCVQVRRVGQKKIEISEGCRQPSYRAGLGSARRQRDAPAARASGAEGRTV
jgi:hypothetical protein